MCLGKAFCNRGSVFRRTATQNGLSAYIYQNFEIKTLVAADMTKKLICYPSDLIRRWARNYA